jgi:hypothetical protein
MSQRSLVVIVIVVVIPIVVPVSVMAPCPRIFQVTTAAFRLATVLPVLAFSIVQFALGIANLVLAPSVIIMITVKTPCGNHSAQE